MGTPGTSGGGHHSSPTIVSETEIFIFKKDNGLMEAEIHIQIIPTQSPVHSGPDDEPTLPIGDEKAFVLRCECVKK